MRIAVLVPSQADFSAELAATIQRTEMEVLDFLWNQPEISECDAQAYVLLSDEPPPPAVGQALLALLKTQSLKGKPILGLGAGAARVLVEGGLIPGLYNNMVGIQLSEATTLQEPAVEAWITLAPDYQYNAFTKKLLKNNVLPVQRRSLVQFVVPPGLWTELKAQGLPVFIYCDAAGQLLPDPPIAGLANKAGNVMALLSHPECYPDNDLLFHSLRAHLESGYIEKVAPLYYWPRK